MSFWRLWSFWAGRILSCVKPPRTVRSLLLSYFLPRVEHVPRTAHIACATAQVRLCLAGTLLDTLFFSFFSPGWSIAAQRSVRNPRFRQSGSPVPLPAGYIQGSPPYPLLMQALYRVIYLPSFNLYVRTPCLGMPLPSPIPECGVRVQYNVRSPRPASLSPPDTVVASTSDESFIIHTMSTQCHMLHAFVMDGQYLGIYK